MNTSSLAVERPAQPGRVAWPFWVAVPIFLAVTLFDTGRSWSRVLGQSPGSLATFLLISAGLFNVRKKPWNLTGIATVLILVLVAWHVLFRGEPLSAAYRLVGPIVMAWVIALQRADTKFVVNLLRMALALFAIFPVSFYLGFWREDGGSMSFPILGRSIVALQLVLGATLVVCLGREGLLGRVVKWLWPAVAVAFLVPVVFTASRKGLICAGLMPVIYFAVVQRRWRLVSLFFAAAVLASVGYVALDEVSSTPAEPVERAIQRFEAGDHLRANLFELAIDLIWREPAMGYGISAPYDEVWQASHGFVEDFSGQPVGVHNGLLVYALMGGFPLLGLFLAFFGGALAGVLAPKSTLSIHANLCAAGCVLLVVILITLLTGGSAEFWKLGWFMMGSIMLIGDVVKREDAAG